MLAGLAVLLFAAALLFRVRFLALRRRRVKAGAGLESFVSDLSDIASPMVSQVVFDHFSACAVRGFPPLPEDDLYLYGFAEDDVKDELAHIARRQGWRIPTDREVQGVSTLRDVAALMASLSES
jgi:hypothetical protein